MVDHSGGRSRHQSCQRVGAEQAWQMTRPAISFRALNLSLQNERSQSFIYCSPAWKGQAPDIHPSYYECCCSLGILLSVLVNYFCWAIQRLQNCDTHWALCVTYISCCASLFAGATNTCINAASIFKLLFLLLLHDNVFSLSKGGKNTNLNKKVFQKQVMYRYFLVRLLSVSSKQIHAPWMETEKCFPNIKGLHKGGLTRHR